ncbi:hypothetical protein HKCCE3408_05780 [Rhodobacterales bacterium HKCCE3408]|nr:hypothetical protein [Rhodobacterales bacterium HKCCE3408]
MDFIISGDVAVAVTVTEVDGNLEFTVRVLQPGDDGYTGQIGEINGLFFDMTGDVDAFASITATALDGTVLAATADEASVSDLGGGINMNGSAISETGKFDIGVLLDKTGLGNGDLQEITFTLDADAELTLADVALQDFGVRLTSVGDPDGSRDGSLKLTGSAPEVPEEPTDLNLANDDFVFVGADAVFDGEFEFTDSGTTTVLTNDITETATGSGPYGGAVTALGDQTVGLDPVVVEGSNGGLLMIYSDGTIDFSANDQFDFLADTETAQTDFVYTIEGGDTATIHVTVLGSDDPGGPGGEGDLGDPPLFDAPLLTDDPFAL